ncbi:MAG: hypothetical protein HQ492_02055 [Woeseiaceae bacterium]|nr:hypothetical protein [Woeseiaceae bacterium]
MLEYFENFSQSRKISPTVLAAALGASTTETLLLNTDRIEQQFGSYGIDILASEAGLRRSSLYSIANGQRVCRTYSIVRFTEDPDSRFGSEHTTVLAGNSLGQVFRAHGWSIHKQTLHIGSFNVDSANSEVSHLMLLTGAQTLALHVYQLLLAKNTQAFEYATIIEAHHPDYLSKADLLDMYHYDDSESLSAESLLRLTALVQSKNKG